MVNSILDTTVLVDILRNYPQAIDWYKSIHQPTLGLTPFIWMELMSGAPNKQARLRAAKLMQRFSMIYPEQSDLDWAMERQIKFELSHGVGAFDCLIASASHRLQLPLYTHNLKHFSPLLKDLAQQPY